MSIRMNKWIAPLGLVLLAGCGSRNTLNVPPAPEPPPPPAPRAVFEVRATNLTAGQPLSPLAVLAHDAGVRPFTIGEAASNGLERLAEGGNNRALLAEIDSRAELSGEAPLAPGASTTLRLELDSGDTRATRLSVMTMLVNTNDAITGVNALDVSGLAVGERRVIDAVAYDAGTEANTEAAGTIPGPADGGEGFNATRDDVANRVTMHGGVVSASDGLSRSVLNHTHRFDNPVARFVITRRR